MKKSLSHFLALLFVVSASLLFSACEQEIPKRTVVGLPQGVLDNEDDDLGTFTPPTRPDGAVFLQPGHCGCKEGEPITLGNCIGFCADKNHAEEILYIDVQVGEEIETSGLIDLAGWCTLPIEYLNPETEEIEVIGSQANCQAIVKDENGETGAITMDQPSVGSKRVKINIAGLDYDKTYRLQISEVQSGAKSDTIQVRKVSTRVSDPVGGPLAQMPVNQYACLNRSTTQDDNNGQLFFETARRSHFYFVEETRPEPLPEAFANIVCHDFITYGTTPINNPLIEETPGHFNVWSKWDPRFFNQSGAADNDMEIHRILRQKIEDQGFTLNENPKVFFPLEYLNGPSIEGETGSGQMQLGYYMLPFVDDSTFKAYCPKQEHYNSNNPLFVSMRETVGVDTEGLYIAKQNNVCDFILITESTLKQIWFYIENGQHIEPNSNTITGKQIQFYWPADPASPFVKKSHQRVFTVKRPNELTCSGTTNVGDSSNQNSSGSFPPHDKRIGCVPRP